MASIYDTWRALTHATSSRKARRDPPPARSGEPAPPTTPKKQKHTTSLPAPSPGNPFRSPQKPSRVYVQAAGFPLRSNEAPATSAEGYESDVSEAEAPPSAPARTPTKPPAPAPAPDAPDAPDAWPLYTPRTKARKRLRGEDVRTPPHAKTSRTALSTRPSALTQSPARADQERRPFARIVSGSAPSAPPADELGPSPQKSAPQREFRPLFRTSSSSAPLAVDSDDDVAMEDGGASPLGALNASQPDLDAPLAPRPALPRTASTTSLDLGAEASPPRRGHADGTRVAPLGVLDDEDGTARVTLQPYQRYGSARERAQRPPADDTMALPVQAPAAPEDAAPAPHEAVDMSALSIRSPTMQGQRVVEGRRARVDQLAQELLAGEPARDASAAATAVPRRGRAGLDVEENAGGAGDSDADTDDDWASEASSAEYGWGDGDMDPADVL